MLRSKLKNRYILVIAAAIICAGFFGFQKAYALDTIEIILKSDDYSYLPDVAKEFIRKNYEENNSLILTEKNQKPGEASSFYRRCSNENIFLIKRRAIKISFLDMFLYTGLTLECQAKHIKYV